MYGAKQDLSYSFSKAWQNLVDLAEFSRIWQNTVENSNLLTNYCRLRQSRSRFLIAKLVETSGRV